MTPEVVSALIAGTVSLLVSSLIAFLMEKSKSALTYDMQLQAARLSDYRSLWELTRVTSTFREQPIGSETAETLFATLNEDYKYPPRLYYLAYAVFALNLVYLGCRNYLCKFHYAWVEWLSANSLWIYLWHIFAFYLWKFFLPAVGSSLPLVVAKMTFLLGFGAAATYAQHQVGQWLRQLSASAYTPSPSR